MRKFYIYITILLLGFSTVGCESFLEERSQDEFRPATTADMLQLMWGEAYPVNEDDFFLPFLELMTDNVQSGFTGANYEGILASGLPAFSWETELLDNLEEKKGAGHGVYQLYYKRIMGCNVVLDYVDEMIGTQAEKNNLRGQALALRSYYYFMLVNLFAPPYNTPGIDMDATPGVVLMLNSAATDEFPRRASMASVYKRIEADLLESVPLLETNGQSNSIYQARPLYPIILLARMYLYQEKWDLALEYAQMVIEKKPELLNFASVFKEDSGYNGIYGINPGVFTLNSPEAIWSFNSGPGIGGFYQVTGGFGVTAPATYSVSSELWSLYKAGSDGVFFSPLNSKDLRRHVYYGHYGDGSMNRVPLAGDKTQKDWSGDTNRNLTRGFRNVEAYLIRAEVNAVLYQQTGQGEYRTQALDDINYIAESRWNTVLNPFEPITADTAEELTQAVREERRREFAFEDHRWFDLRRYGMPEITHTYQGTQYDTPRTYTLPQGSDRYTLRIPKKIIERNPAIVQNP